MGGSTNTVLHLLAAAYEARIPFDMADIDRLSRSVPNLCKVAPATQKYHMEDVHRAGGVIGILGELDRAGLMHRGVPTVHSATLGEALDRWDTRAPTTRGPSPLPGRSGGVPTQVAFSQDRQWPDLDLRPRGGLHSGSGARLQPRRRSRGACSATWRSMVASLRPQGWTRRTSPSPGRRGSSRARRQRSRRSWGTDPGRGRGRHPLRGAQGGAGNAGDALPNQLPEVQGARQGLRPDHGRALLRRDLWAVHRAHVPGGGRGRCHCPRGRGRPHRASISRPVASSYW